MKFMIIWDKIGYDDGRKTGRVSLQYPFKTYYGRLLGGNN